MNYFTLVCLVISKLQVLAKIKIVMLYYGIMILKRITFFKIERRRKNISEDTKHEDTNFVKQNSRIQILLRHIVNWKIFKNIYMTRHCVFYVIRLKRNSKKHRTIIFVVFLNMKVPRQEGFHHCIWWATVHQWLIWN